jgi:hypothetical protein
VVKKQVFIHYRFIGCIVFVIDLSCFNFLPRVSHKNVEECTVAIDEERCEKLKKCIRSYFSAEEAATNVEIEKVCLKKMLNLKGTWYVINLTLILLPFYFSRLKLRMKSK